MKHLSKVKCKNCGVIFEVKNYRKDTAKYCSNKCKSVLFRVPFTDERKQKVRIIAKKNTTELWKNLEFIEKHTGENNPNWKGGITDKNNKIRKTVEYKLWRKSVFERDNYTCIWCGKSNKNGERTPLQADHIKSFSQYPELRFAIDNGRTLCIPCHKKTNSYLNKYQKNACDYDLACFNEKIKEARTELLEEIKEEVEMLGCENGSEVYVEDVLNKLNNLSNKEK